MRLGEKMGYDTTDVDVEESMKSTTRRLRTSRNEQKSH